MGRLLIKKYLTPFGFKWRGEPVTRFGVFGYGLRTGGSFDSWVVFLVGVCDLG